MSNNEVICQNEQHIINELILLLIDMFVILEIIDIHHQDINVQNWRSYYNHFLRVEAFSCQMKTAKSKQIVSGEDQVRRSTRKRTQLKFDYYIMSTGRQDDIGDIYDQQDYSPKQSRKRRRGSEDFDQRISKKKNINRLVNLLGWKLAIELPELPEQGTYGLHKVKNILKSDLSKFGAKVQGIFINVKWNTDPFYKKEQGISIQQFAQLNLESNHLISNGIVFMWSEKSILHSIIKVMEAKGFTYVENLQIVFLDLDKAQAQMNKFCSLPQKVVQNPVKKPLKRKNKLQTTSEDTEEHNSETQWNQKQSFLNNMDKLSHVDPNSLFVQSSSQLFKRTKLQLLMFRKFPNKKQNLELRHQRNPDVLFDIVSPKTFSIDKTTKNHVYNLIQTLLPKAMIENGPFKLMEIWGNKDVPRKGWITLSDK